MVIQYDVRVDKRAFNLKSTVLMLFTQSSIADSVAQMVKQWGNFNILQMLNTTWHYHDHLFYFRINTFKCQSTVDVCSLLSFQ